MLTDSRFLLRRKGAATSQYALIVGLIAIVALFAVGNLGKSSSAVLNGVGNRLANVSGGNATTTQAPPPVIQPPVAGNVSLGNFNYIGLTQTYTAATFLASASDPQSLPLSLVSVQATTTGTVSLVSGNVEFTPNSSGFHNFTYTVSNGTQTATGLATVTVNYAPNCNAIMTVSPSAADGVYSIQPPSQPVTPVLCDMTPEGGWTLVMRGLGGDYTGWATTGALRVSGNNLSIGATFKYDDAFINAARALDIYRIVTDGTFSQTRYAANSCVYAHTTAVGGGVCANTFSNSNLTGGFAQVDNFSGHHGIADIQNDGAHGSIVTRHVDGVPANQWVVGLNGSICTAGSTGCNFQLWVR